MRYFRALIALILDIFRNRKLLWQMTKRDFRQRYLGSYLGILWAFIQPAITVLIFWFVFQVGFKAMPVENFPFILWLVCGMFPWFFISESILSATNSVIESSFLVKKIVFRVELLPIVKIMSALVVHIFFCRSFIHDVRDLRLLNFNLQRANNLLFFRDDLPVARNKLADKFADGFFARRGTIRGDVVAVRILGNADFLEFKNDSRRISNFFKVKSRVLFG